MLYVMNRLSTVVIVWGWVRMVKVNVAAARRLAGPAAFGEKVHAQLMYLSSSGPC